MKNILNIISILFIMIGLVLFMEGRFKFSITSIHHLNKLIPNELNIENKCLIGSKEKKDIVIEVYYDNKNTMYIIEYSKNTLFDLYSLTQINEVKKNNIGYNSVISSAIYNYAYNIDFSTYDIKIFEPTISSNVYYSIQMIIIGVVCQFYINNYKKINN